MRDIYINSNLNPITKFTISSKSTDFRDLYRPLSNDHEDLPNQHENSHKPGSETGYPIVDMMKSQKQSQQHDQNLQMEGKPLENTY